MGALEAGMLKLADLAGRPDFNAGPLHVSPARRLVEGPAGKATLEPIVMKVLLLLLDSRGSVVTRDELFGSAWGGVYVGDDSLNRAIARIRKVSADTAPGLLEVETIPRTGYRITGEILTQAGIVDRPTPAAGTSGLSRRTMVASATGLMVAGAAGVALWSMRAQQDRRFNDLVQRGVDGLDFGDGSPKPIEYFRQAVAIRPDDSVAQGFLAYALVAGSEAVTNDRRGEWVALAERSAKKSLEADPADANARLARILLRRATLDLATNEDLLRAVLASAPDNIFAMRLLWNLLQCAGRSRDALGVVQRAVAIKPLAAGNNFPLAQLLWINGRTAEADRVIDRTLQYWPGHRFARFARFTIFTFTGRARAALAMLESDEARPQSFSPASVALWRTSLSALIDPSAPKVAAAREANLNAGTADPRLSYQAVLTLGGLNEVDAAFEVANSFLIYRPPGTKDAKPAASQPNSVAWRFTPWLFTPPVGPLRADPRFQALCDGTGLTAYWKKRGIQPDYKVARV